MSPALVEQFYGVMRGEELTVKVKSDDARRCKEINETAFALLARTPALAQIRFFDDVLLAGYREEETALHVAAFYLNPELMRRLILLGADVDSPDTDGCSALYRVVRTGLSSTEWYLQAKLIAMELLLAADADVNKPTNSGQTPLHAAVENSLPRIYAAVIGLLLRYGADPNRLCSGVAPIHGLKFDAEALKQMLAYGADVNLPDSTGQTRFMTAYGAEVPLMLNHGADVRARDKHRRTVLHYNVGWDHPEDVELLLQAGSSPNARDRDGYTPLHYAVSGCAPQCMRLMLAAGAEVNARSHHKETPLTLVHSRKRLFHDYLGETSSCTPEERTEMETLLKANVAGIDAL